MKRLLLTLVIALTTLAAFAQRRVDGRVSDNATGESLIGATVAVKGSATGTVTGTDGSFTVTVPNDQAILTISYTGYETREVSVGTQSRMDILLTASTTLGGRFLSRLSR